MHTIVVQFGLATIPLGIDASAPALTSGTTSGTSGSIRQADELSMTTAPAAATRGANTRDADAPFENNAMSSPENEAVSVSSTTISSSPHGSRRPADRAEAKYRIDEAGNPRDASSVR